MNEKLFKLMGTNTYYPSKAYTNDAGYDVYLPHDIQIKPHKAQKRKEKGSVHLISISGLKSHQMANTLYN